MKDAGLVPPAGFEPATHGLRKSCDRVPWGFYLVLQVAMSCTTGLPCPCCAPLRTTIRTTPPACSPGDVVVQQCLHLIDVDTPAELLSIGAGLPDSQIFSSASSHRSPRSRR